MVRKAAPLAVALAALAALLASPAPAFADHTDPSQPIVPLEPGFPAGEPIVRGAGTFEHVRNFPAPVGTALSGSGTDHRYFRIGDRLYVSVGTLGQGDEGSVGQRIFLLKDGDEFDPRWVADHGSAACAVANTSITGLQHDIALLGSMPAVPVSMPVSRSLAVTPELLVDATDATGRCHDPNGGGLELIDVSGLGQTGFVPREVHLIRHAGFSHTVTVDDLRPWVVYNSTSDFAGRPWIDVIDTRTCLGLQGRSLNAKRDACRPKVYRIPFQQAWSRQVGTDGALVAGSEAACHDITSRGYRIYCASLNATLIFDVRDLTRPTTGGILGRPLECARINGTKTGASVTDCGGVEGSTAANTVPQARGWRFLGTINHAGRDCTPVPATNCNTNTVVASDEDVAVSHEADPTLDADWMFVTDERGGGVVPPGASCVPGASNPVGHGGIHVYDVRDPADIRYARTSDGGKAIWFGEVVVPAATFCDVHVIEQIPGEQRLIAAYYSQGTKLLDYFVDDAGRWSFRETASIVFPHANTWTVDVFDIVANDDGTKTYHLLASDIDRGVDIFTWRSAPNPIGTPAPVSAPVGSRRADAAADAGATMLLLSGLLTAIRRIAAGRRRR
jgi:hypothetical protein